ncbi:putative MFS family arabinose efflux permease [Tumebacillus sp. BK434]|uniref:MFS transporter n=1 Tax=Tumebacillus sp. BK434 TaxID=2512169 RepID=UPI001047EEEF|nr:MFS transporter [Tumebacillus sp. BK434]TCP59424.1 putative MFS family arabinose efflux permease [Tumebacillus sp. BK434]
MSEKRPSMFAPVKQRSFRNLFIGSLFSDSANWLDMTALAVVIAYEWGMGATEIAYMMIVLSLPWIFLGPLVAVWADRLPRRALMVICVLIRACLILGLFFVPNLYAMLCLVFLRATVATLYNPARMSAIRSLVDEEMLPQALSLGQMSMYLTQVGAPMLGGALIPLIGARQVFLVEVGFLLLAALFLSFMPPLKSEAADPNKERAPHFWKQFAEGIGHVRSKRILSVSIILMTIGMFIVMLYDGMLVIWTKDIGLGEHAFGYLISALGIGSVVGALLMGSLPKWHNKPLHTLVALALVCGLLNSVIGLGGLSIFSLDLWLWFLFFMFFGVFSAAATIPFSYIIQKETPGHLIGRVTGVSASTQAASMLLAPATGAWLTSYIKIGGTLLAAGLFMAVIAVFVLMFLTRILREKAGKVTETTAPSA